MNHINLATDGWPDYELLDSGDNKKLERFGSFVLIRPETQAIWKPLHPELWKSAEAEFLFRVGSLGPLPNPGLEPWSKIRRSKAPMRGGGKSCLAQANYFNDCAVSSVVEHYLDTTKRAILATFSPL